MEHGRPVRGAMSQISLYNNKATVWIRNCLHFYFISEKNKQTTQLCIHFCAAEQIPAKIKYKVYIYKVNLLSEEKNIQKAQVRIKLFCNWLSAPGSPAAAGVIWLWRRRLGFPKVNCNSGKAQHGSQTWTSKRCSDRLADISLSDPPGGGLRYGGRVGAARGHHPDRGGFLRLPWLVRTEAERTAVRQTLLIVCLSRHVVIHRIITSSGTRSVSKWLIRNVPYWN